VSQPRKIEQANSQLSQQQQQVFKIKTKIQNQNDVEITHKRHQYDKTHDQ